MLRVANDPYQDNFSCRHSSSGEALDQMPEIWDLVCDSARASKEDGMPVGVERVVTCIRSFECRSECEHV